MSRELLDRAYNLITREEYTEARNILLDLQDRSSTARRWLANIDDILGIDDEPDVPVEGDPVLETEVDHTAAMMEAVATEEALIERAEEAMVEAEMELDAAAAETDFVLPDDVEPPLAPEPDEPEDEELFEPVIPEPDEPEDEVPVEPVMPEPADDFEPIMPEDEAPVMPAVDDEVPVPVAADDLMPIDETADVLPTDEVHSGDGSMRWEYREIVVRTWQQHIDNIEYALNDGEGGEKITIDDAYTKLLNESGEQGWELVSEQVLPQQYVRLLLKRMVRG